MGFFEKAKFFASAAKDIKEAVKEQKRKNEEFRKMSSVQLCELNDSDLREAVSLRTDDKVFKFQDMIEGINSLNEKERIYYIATTFELEWANGGLCQYFVNSSRETAPEISSCLEFIGAYEHKKFFDEFVRDNKIDLNGLSVFIYRNGEDYESKTKLYPFNEFDEKFSELEPLEKYLAAFVRANYEYF